LGYITAVHVFIKYMQYGTLYLHYKDGTSGSVSIENLTGAWVQKTLTANTNKVVIRVRVVIGPSTNPGRFDMFYFSEDTSVGRYLSFTAVSGQIKKSTTPPTTRVYINAAKKLYKA